MIHHELPLDTRPIPRPIHWIICPFVSIESTQQLHQDRERTAAPASLSAYSSSITIERGRQLRYGAPQQLQHHRARTAVPSTSSADSSSGMGRHSGSSITERAQQLRQHRARTAAPVWGASAAPASPSAHTAPPEHLGLKKNIPAIGYKR